MSWNDDRALSLGRFWCVHTHFLMSTEGAGPNGYRNLIHADFGCPRDPRINGNGSVFVSLLRGASDVKNTLRYASGACALVDHNPKGGRHYRKRLSFVERANPRDKSLRPARQAEFTRLMHELGPEAFIVLSGLQRRGDRLNVVGRKSPNGMLSCAPLSKGPPRVELRLMQRQKNRWKALYQRSMLCTRASLVCGRLPQNEARSCPQENIVPNQLASPRLVTTAQPVGLLSRSTLSRRLTLARASVTHSPFRICANCRHRARWELETSATEALDVS